MKYYINLFIICSFCPFSPFSLLLAIILIEKMIDFTLVKLQRQWFKWKVVIGKDMLI
jgi:hypothetical protein